MRSDVLEELHISQSIGLLHITKLSLENSTTSIFNLIQLITMFIRIALVSEYYLLGDFYTLFWVVA